MRAMIFAAGRGERMRPLTDRLPKPLLEVGGKALIVWHLEHLARIGIEDVVINTSWLAEKLPAALGDGSRWGLRLRFLYEGESPLETGGGMLHALPYLGAEPFLLINGDVFCDFPLANLLHKPIDLAHLVMVDRPPHASQGDFVLDHTGKLLAEGSERLTYSGIGVYSPSLFERWPAAIGPLEAKDASPPRFRLAPLLRAAMLDGRVSGEHFRGGWMDVGTPERLAALRARVFAQAGDKT